MRGERMYCKRSILLAVIVTASALIAVAQTDNSRKETPQNQTSPAAGQTAPDAAKTQQGSTGLGTPASTPQSDRGVSPKAEERLYREVRHELVMLPNLSLWDNLAY